MPPGLRRRARSSVCREAAAHSPARRARAAPRAAAGRSRGVSRGVRSWATTDTQPPPPSAAVAKFERLSVSERMRRGASADRPQGGRLEDAGRLLGIPRRTTRQGRRLRPPPQKRLMAARHRQGERSPRRIWPPSSAISPWLNLAGEGEVLGQLRDGPRRHRRARQPLKSLDDPETL